MPGYAPACRDEVFAGAREQYAKVEEWLAGEAAGLQHADLEEQLEARGRELLRRLLQGHLDLQAAAEERRDGVTGADGAARTRAERGRTRPLVTVFGPVTVSRIAYRSPGLPNVHLLDAALNLPREKHSHGLRKLAAVEAARGSMEAARAAAARATGVNVAKRQLEELAYRAAADVEAFYLDRRPGPAPADHALVLTFDGKGVVMRPESLRPAAARAAAAAEGKLATRLSPGEKSGRKRMAELACVYDAAPVPRTPEDVITSPARKRRKKKAQAGEAKGKGKPREPQARGKWLTASVTDDIPSVIAAAFGEAERRDPGRQREWVVLVDGNNTQIEAAAAEAAARGISVTIVIDFIHVLEYLSAPRGALPYPPRSGERLEGISLDLMAHPAPKGQPGKIACQKTGERAQAYGTRCRGIRAIWRKLNCLKPNLQKMQFEHLPERRLKPAPPLRQDPDVPAASPGRGTMPCQGIQGDERAA